MNEKSIKSSGVWKGYKVKGVGGIKLGKLKRSDKNSENIFSAHHIYNRDQNLNNTFPYCFIYFNFHILRDKSIRLCLD